MSKQELEAALELVNDQLEQMRKAPECTYNLIDVLELTDSRQTLMAKLQEMEVAA